MKLINKIKPLLIAFLISTSLATIYINISHATDQTVTCDEASGCSGVTGPLFNETNIYPTQIFTQTVTAINDYADDRDFAVEISSLNYSDSTPSMADMLSISISEQESGLIVYSAPSINDWKNAGYILLSNIPSGETRHYIFTSIFANVGNEYQSKNLSFDLNLGFEALPPHSSLATTSISCDNRNFDAIMILKNDGVLVSGVDIEFTYNGSTITKTTNSEGKAQAGFTQSGEQSVIAIPQSGEYSSQSIFVSAPTGCEDGGGGAVAGITTYSSQFYTPTQPKEESDLKGEETQEGLVEGISDCNSTFPWWIPLVIQLVIVVGYYLLISHQLDNNFIKTLFIPLVISILSQVAHQVIGCDCSSAYWCERYWILNLIIFTLTYIVYQIRLVFAKE